MRLAFGLIEKAAPIISMSQLSGTANMKPSSSAKRTTKFRPPTKKPKKKSQRAEPRKRIVTLLEPKASDEELEKALKNLYS